MSALSSRYTTSRARGEAGGRRAVAVVIVPMEVQVQHATGTPPGLPKRR